MKQRIFERVSSARCDVERGAVMFLVAITALIVMVAGAIAVDLSAVATRGQSLQNAADSAALAGVQAFRSSMGERTEANDDDKNAAIEAVNDLLAQNGITDITPNIEFPDDENDTEVRVTLFDDDAGFLLSGFTGGNAGTVERSATARFERCEDNCIKEVDIPPPFQPVNAFGDGDGYKAIPVGDRLYSINHQSGGSRGNQQMTCVLRGERDRTDIPTLKTQLCWDDPVTDAPIPGITAYPTGNIPSKTPEMPHAAVSGSKIYWASSTSSGHYMFCFETETPAPCSTPLLLNNNSAATNLPNRLIHRGGGTVEANGLIYTFTDDHKVHCIIPGDFMSHCAGYPKDDSMGALGFPDNEAADENHGSSIDRVFDESIDRIYSTFHIDNVPNQTPACTFSGDNMSVPSGVVTLKNANSGLFIAINGSYNGLIDGVDPEDTTTHWEISGGTSNGDRYYRFKSVAADDNGYNRYIAIDADGYGDELELVSGSSSRRVFRVFADTTTSQIRSWYEWSGNYHWVSEGSSGGAIEFTSGPVNGLWSDWVIRPWQCEVPDPGPDMYGAVAHEQGTYLNCFDVSGTGGACAGFVPYKLHNDWDSFSGRLFFYRNGAGDPTAVCSTGFTEHWDWNTDMSSYTETQCVDLYSGAEVVSAESDMAAFTAALAARNTGDPIGGVRWGTWGDPHYNSHTNRLFYPTHRIQSTILCWDFDTGPCVEGLTRAAISGTNITQDYGYFSEGNCVYALGHNAIFWAFRADDIDEECNGSGKTTPITPCNCGGSLYWGTLSFDVTEEQFEEFDIVINDDDGNQLYPASLGDGAAPPHSLLRDGDTIDLNFIPVTNEDQRLWITVSVVAKDGVDPWEDGAGSQSFTIEIERTPRLTD